MNTAFKTRRDFLQGALAVGGVFASAGSVFAQSPYPNKPIKWVVGYQAGGGSDTTTRVVAEAMARNIGQPMVVDNKPGASGAVAAASMKSLPDDGYNILCMDMGTYTLNPHFYPNVSYDPTRDFRMVGSIVTTPLGLTVPAELNVSSVADFVKLLKSKPADFFNFATSGAGNITHLTMELFMRQNGLRMTHVPYKGSPAALADLAAGRVAAYFCDVNSPQPFVQTGKAKILAVAGQSRLNAYPNIPTMKEAGYEVNAPYWYGPAVLRSTPDAIVEKLNESLNKAMADPQVVAKFNQLGFLVSARTSAKEADDFARADRARMQTILKELNIKI